jgi:hypothetical protein
MTSLYSVVIAAAAGFLTRPCCVIPAALSIAGLGSLGVAEAIATYRSAFLSASALMLGCSLWLTFRRPGGWFIKTASAGAMLIAFLYVSYFSRGTL